MCVLNKLVERIVVKVAIILKDVFDRTSFRAAKGSNSEFISTPLSDVTKSSGPLGVVVRKSSATKFSYEIGNIFTSAHYVSSSNVLSNFIQEHLVGKGEPAKRWRGRRRKVRKRVDGSKGNKCE